MMFVLPSWLAFDFVEGFFAATADWRIDDLPLTHTAGVVICHCKTPIRQARALVKQIADEIKTRTRVAPPAEDTSSTEGRAPRGGNAVGIEVFESLMPPEDGIGAHRARSYGVPPEKVGDLILNLAFSGDAFGVLRTRIRALASDDQAGLPKSQLYPSCARSRRKRGTSDPPRRSRRLHANCPNTSAGWQTDPEWGRARPAVPRHTEAGRRTRAGSDVVGLRRPVRWRSAAGIAMTERVTIGVTLTLRSPFLSRGLAGGPVGLDAAQLRDEDDNPVLPGTQLQGVLREALCDLAAAAPGIVTQQQIEALFGKGSPEFATAGEYDQPSRGCAIFGDLTASCQKLNQETTRIEIDDERGTVRRGHLQVVELVAPWYYGNTVVFTGEIALFWPDGKSGPLIAALDKALKLVPAIGAFKSAGFGEMVPESSTARNAGQYRLKVLPAAADTRDRIGFSVTFDRLLLVNTKRVTDNAFLGADIVPSAVLKGALARKLELAGEAPEVGKYEKALTKLIISHAFPADAARMPSGEILLLSLVAVPEESSSAMRCAWRDRGLGSACCLPAGLVPIRLEGGMGRKGSQVARSPRIQTAGPIAEDAHKDRRWDSCRKPALYGHRALCPRSGRYHKAAAVSVHDRFVPGAGGRAGTGTPAHRIARRRARRHRSHRRHCLVRTLARGRCGAGGETGCRPSRPLRGRATLRRADRPDNRSERGGSL